MTLYKFCIMILLIGCSESTGDIVFVLDASGSIERENFERIVQFVGGVVQSLPIRSEQSPDAFQVGLISFSDRVDVRFHLNNYTNKELLLAAINVPYTRGRTNLDVALRYILAMFTDLKFCD